MMTKEERKLINEVRSSVVDYLISIDANVTNYEAYADKVTHVLFNSIQRKFKKLQELDNFKKHYNNSFKEG